MLASRLFAVAHCPFEAARRVSILPPDHRCYRMHGHSFLAKVRKEVGSEDTSAYDVLDSMLEDAVAPLNYEVLNGYIEIPTDENIARFIRDRMNPRGVDMIGVQSTRHQGVDIDNYDIAHIWRRFRFEAAHQLPNVPDHHPCGRMHGHGFELVLHARKVIADRDTGTDFDRLEALWLPLSEVLDHKCLNDIPGLENPTSELISKWVWEQLKNHSDSLSGVTVYETNSAGCQYDGETHRIWKQFHFESALEDPNLTSPPERRLHGHSYVGRLHLTCDLDELMGWTIDYGDVKEQFRPVYDQLDHHSLQDIDSLRHADVGSLLFWIRDQIQEQLPAMDAIDLLETPTKGAFLSWGDYACPPLSV